MKPAVYSDSPSLMFQMWLFCLPPCHGDDVRGWCDFSRLMWLKLGAHVYYKWLTLPLKQPCIDVRNLMYCDVAHLLLFFWWEDHYLQVGHPRCVTWCWQLALPWFESVIQRVFCLRSTCNWGPALPGSFVDYHGFYPISTGILQVLNRYWLGGTFFLC